MFWTVSHPRITGAELLKLEETPSEITMRGWVVATLEGLDCAVAYELTADQRWVTRQLSVSLDSNHTRLEVEHDGEGNWSVDGMERPDLIGCSDVDIGISPSTNTLPIRRLRLDIGQKARLDAVWIRFPGLTVEVLPQSYERTAEAVYEYRSDSFRAELEVDERGLVIRYGDDLWRAIP